MWRNEKQVQVMDDKASKRNAGRAHRGGLPRGAVKLLIVIAAIAALAIVGFGINKREQETAATEAPLVNVTVMTVTAEPNLPDAFDLPAVVEPNRIVTVSAEVAGRIEWIGPKEGMRVREGDRLVQLNTDLLQTELERTQAQAKYDQTEFERKKGLVEGGAAPSRDLDEAATKLAVSRAQLEEVRARLARTRIVAPITGVLDHLPVEIGEYVQAGTAVADIVDTATVKVVVEVPERDISFFSVGDKADVLAMVKGREVAVAGTITFISELADPQTRSTRMEIMLRNDDHRLRSGQIVQARLTRQVLQDVIMIPLLAVIPMEEGKSVYVVESSKAERREVKLGVIKGDRIQIPSGLQPGDQLIVAGHRFVAPGQNVNVVSEGK
jgi:membrane fusion protein (multidrug efflux system)